MLSPEGWGSDTRSKGRAQTTIKPCFQEMRFSQRGSGHRQGLDKKGGAYYPPLSPHPPLSAHATPLSINRLSQAEGRGFMGKGWGEVRVRTKSKRMMRGGGFFTRAPPTTVAFRAKQRPQGTVGRALRDEPREGGGQPVAVNGEGQDCMGRRGVGDRGLGPPFRRGVPDPSYRPLPSL